MAQTIGVNTIESLLEMIRINQIREVRLQALDAVSRLPLDQQGWQAVADVCGSKIMRLAPESPERQAVLQLSVRIPLLSVRTRLREMAVDPTELDADLIADALAQIRDPSQTLRVLDMVRAGDYEKLVILAGLPLEDTGLSREDFPQLGDDSNANDWVWRALALARLGDYESLDSMMLEDVPEPDMFWGDPWTPYNLIATIRPIPPDMYDHLLSIMRSIAQEERWKKLIVWAATGIADAEGHSLVDGEDESDGIVDVPTVESRIEPDHDQVSRAIDASTALLSTKRDEVNLDDLVYLPPEKVASFVIEYIQYTTRELKEPTPDSYAEVWLGNRILDVIKNLPDVANWPAAKLIQMHLKGERSVLDDDQLAWVIAQGMPEQTIHEMINLLTPDRPSQEIVQILALIGKVGDQYSGRGASPWRGAGPGAVEESGPIKLIDDRVYEAMVSSDSFEPNQRTYANLELLESDGATKVPTTHALAPGYQFLLEVSIEKGIRGIVEDPRPLPRELPPYLDIIVSSTDFQLAPEGKAEELGINTTVEGRLNRRDEEPWSTQQNGGLPYLRFIIQAPDLPITARARVNYFYRKHLVQSHLIKATIGEGAGKITGVTDFETSEQLSNLETLPERKRQVSLLINESSQSYDVVIRNAGGNNLTESRALALNKDAIDEIINRIRERLDQRSPKKLRRTKAQLKEDLIILASRGHYLKGLVVNQIGRAIFPTLARHREVVIQVARPTSSSYTFPWNFIYEHYIKYNHKYDTVARKELKLCQCVEEWDDEGDALLYPEGNNICKYESADNANVLCPLGFWGFRYPIEQKSKERSPVKDIATQPEFNMVVARTSKIRSSTKTKLGMHLQHLQSLIDNNISNHNPHFDVDTKAKAKEYLGIENLALIYFYCHGKTVGGDTCLAVGNDEEIPALEFEDWVNNWLKQGKTVWDQIRPLIFINACHSVDIKLESPVDYLNAFITVAYAAGIIGTEIGVDQSLAIDFAQMFFNKLFDKKDVGDALQETRMNFLNHGNLLGLMYTPYCMLDLSLAL